MAKKNEAYVDTAALIAFADRSDTHHSLFRHLFANPPPLLTTTLVIAEGHGWFLKRFDRNRALQFLTMVEDITPLQVLTTGADDMVAASALLRKFSVQDLTLTDAAGLALMHQRKITTCWSTDFHLSLTGVTLVINAG